MKKNKKTLTDTISRLPLQTLAIGERDDVGSGVDTALRTAAPHALRGLAGAVGAAGVQRARLLTGRAGALIGVSWRDRRTLRNVLCACGAETFSGKFYRMRISPVAFSQMRPWAVAVHGFARRPDTWGSSRYAQKPESLGSPGSQRRLLLVKGDMSSQPQ